ncbi:MAG TPA: membrane protein insertase YidC [Vicinamibacterales bacterium]
MEKRVLIAIFLSFLVLYAFQGLFEPPKPKKTATAAASTTAGSKGRAAGKTPAASDAKASPEAPDNKAVEPVLPPATALVSARTAQDIRVDTPNVDAVFSNQGATLKSWKLKNYKDAKGNPLELVVTELLGQYPSPFSLKVDDAAVTQRLNSALYAVKGPEPATDASGAPIHLSFEYQDASGLRAEKTFTIDPRKYTIDFQTSVVDHGKTLNPAIEWGPGLGDVWNSETNRYLQKPQGLYFDAKAGKVERLSAKNLGKQSTYETAFGYVGVDDNYFMSTLLFPTEPVKVDYEPLAVPQSSAPKAPTENLVAYTLQPSKAGQAMRFFFGPKDFDLLASINRDLVRAIDFGWFSFLVVPLLKALKWINGFVGNYGWSIIILTVLINMAIFPLRHKSVVSMRRMQEIQPQMKAIQARYSGLKATDPAKQKMNTEMMALYKEKGVNPASGCLPMILTLPVLYAIYALLETAIEIRGAPWFGWITDLSLRDPLYITPILMGISMVWQQKMTPSTADPSQQKMMMFMPIVFTVMFLWAPSGLVLYWFVSNLWGIGQQYVTNYLIGPPVIKAVRPPAERRLKRVGESKTQAAAKH